MKSRILFTIVIIWFVYCVSVTLGMEKKLKSKLERPNTNSINMNDIRNYQNPYSGTQRAAAHPIARNSIPSPDSIQAQAPGPVKHKKTAQQPKKTPTTSTTPVTPIRPHKFIPSGSTPSTTPASSGTPPSTTTPASSGAPPSTTPASSGTPPSTTPAASVTPPSTTPASSGTPPSSAPSGSVTPPSSAPSGSVTPPSTTPAASG
jgi:hypothetical protein